MLKQVQHDEQKPFRIGGGVFCLLEMNAIGNNAQNQFNMRFICFSVGINGSIKASNGAVERFAEFI